MLEAECNSRKPKYHNIEDEWFKDHDWLTCLSWTRWFCSYFSNPGFPRDCQEVKDRGNVASGQYMISPKNDEHPFTVYCDMKTDGGGWTVCVYLQQ